MANIRILILILIFGDEDEDPIDPDEISIRMRSIVFRLRFDIINIIIFS